RSKLAENHPLTVLCCLNQAISLNVQGRFAEAQPFCQKALEIGRLALGEDHPSTVSSYAVWAINLNARGRYDEAEAMARAATRSYEVTRLRISFAGLDRAEFAARRSPLPLLAAIQARQGRIREAWEHWEAGLARG